MPRVFFGLISAIGLLAIPLGSSPKRSGRPFIEVRGYAFNLEESRGYAAIIEDGKLNPTTVDPEGVVLDEAQTRRLLAAISGKFPEHPIAACFNPRHAFVFYNEARHPFFSVNVCFECLGIQTSPLIGHRPYDFPALAELCAELKLPGAPDAGFQKWFDDLRKMAPAN